MKILFVCTGNTCRSPMAEAIAKKIFPKDFSFSSAGIYANEYEAASEGAILALKEMGIDLKEHLSKRIEEDMLKEADLVLAMTKSHKLELLAAYPEYSKKVKTLCEAAGEQCDVPDPYGQSRQVYISTAQKIKELLEKIKKLLEQK